jgi:hypothetical protein
MSFWRKRMLVGMLRCGLAQPSSQRKRWNGQFGLGEIQVDAHVYPTAVFSVKHAKVKKPRLYSGHTRKDSLSHVDTPDACATAQIHDPWAFLVEKGSAMKSIVASNEEDLMKDVQSL